MSAKRTSVGDKLPCPSCQGTGFRLATKFGDPPSVCRECGGLAFVKKTGNTPASSTAEH